MKNLAYITSMVLIVFGILVMLGALTLGVINTVRTGSRAFAASPVQPGLRLAGGGLIGWLGGLILTIFILIQGLMVVALGEGLYLLANLSGKITGPSA